LISVFFGPRHSAALPVLSCEFKVSSRVTVNFQLSLTVLAALGHVLCQQTCQTAKLLRVIRLNILKH